MYRGAMRSILSELIRQGRLTVVPEFSVDEPKTRLLADRLIAMNLTDVLILIEGCLLYTSDAADERSSVDLGGRRIINKKKKKDRDWTSYSK